MKRLTVRVLGGTVLTALALNTNAARATTDGPVAIAATAGAGAAASIACLVTRIRANADEVEAEDEDSEVAATADQARDDRFSRPGWRVGMSYSHGQQHADESEQASQQAAHEPFQVTLVMDEWKPGLSGRVGYRCHARYSTEVEVEWLDSFNGTVSETDQGPFSAIALSPIHTSVNVKGYLHTGRVQPFGLFGMGALTVEGKATDLSGTAGTSRSQDTMLTLRFGGGLDVYITRSIVAQAKASYVLPITGVDTFRYVSVGIGLDYRF